MAQRKTPRRVPEESRAPGAVLHSHHGQSIGRVVGSRKNTTRPPRAAGDRGGLWLYGAHAVLAALANPNREITRLVVTSEAAKRHVGELRRAAETIEGVRLASMLPSGAVHQGIAALAKPLADLHIEDCKPDAARCVVLVLDQVTDPRNVGAILRSAAAFGAKAVVVPAHHSPPESGALAKAASGALEKVPFIRVPNLARGLEQLADQGYWRVALTAEGRNYDDVARKMEETRANKTAISKPLLDLVDACDGVTDNRNRLLEFIAGDIAVLNVRHVPSFRAIKL